MRIHVKWMIAILILSNLLTFAIVKIYFPTTVHNNSFLLKMKGQGDHWKINDYEFVWISGHGAMGGSANITYLADPNDITGRIKVETYDYFKGEAAPHFGYSVPANRLDDDASFVTGGGGAYPPDDLSVRELVESTYFIIHWQTKDREQHQEKIHVELDYYPHILSQFHDIEF